MRCRFGVAIVMLYAAAVFCPAQSTTSTSRPAVLPTTRPTGAAVEAVIEAEQIVRLRKAIETDKQQIATIEQKLNDPESEFQAAEADFGKLDAQLAELKKRSQQLEEDKEPQPEEAVQAQIQELTKLWDAARTRFGLAVEERKTLQEKLKTLQTKLDQNTRTLSDLLAAPEKSPAAAVAAASSNKHASTTGTVASQATIASQAPVTQTTVPTSQPAGATPPAAAKILQPKNQALVQAVQEAETKKVEAQQADERLQTVEKASATLAQTIESERRLLEIARKKQEQAEEEQKRLREELKLAAGVPARTRELWSRIFAAQQREAQAVTDAKASEDRLRELGLEQTQIETQKQRTAEEASAKKREVEQAEKKIQQLQNPFTPRNMLQWVINHGPRLFMIVVGMTVLQLLVRVVSRRIADLVAHNSSRGSLGDRQNRAYTLVGVFRQTALLVILAGGTTMFLEEIGVPVIPLLGGAAVVGLAVAFGAQNLIRDYFAGFMVLVEDQYSVGDVVRIGQTAGLVERITLRMTMLRDTEGAAHFIPHGSITTVSNLTHSWSKAMFDIPVSYKEDVDRVISVLENLATELGNDPAYADCILGEPEMLGVDAFADSAVIIKFVIKTRPVKQWVVKREMLRRIKSRFDALGIEIPYPQMTIYHRRLNDTAVQSALPEGEGAGHARNGQPKA